MRIQLGVLLLLETKFTTRPNEGWVTLVVVLRKQPCLLSEDLW